MYDVILTCNYSPWSAYRGGGQKSTHMIASALARAGKRVCVVYSKGLFERISVPAALPYEVRWAFFFAVKPGISSPLRWLNGLSFYFKVRGLLRDRRGSGGVSETAVHGNGDEASLLGYLSRRGRFIYSHRYPGFEPYMFRTRWGTWKTRLYVFFREPRFAAIALALRNADTVVCTSLSSAEQLRACFQVPARKIRVIPNGIDPEFLEAPFPERARTGIVYYGRLTQAKGVDTLLRAYAGLAAARRARHPLTLIGDGPYRQELQRLADSLGVSGDLRWKGWMASEGLARTLLAHALAALPSREESFGNTMLETLATGQTLVTTRAGSIPEVVGDQATLVPPDDAPALRVALESLLDAPPDPEKAAGRRAYVRDRYSWERTAEAYLALYGFYNSHVRIPQPPEPPAA
jgi:glycosyltransferase involved in cell wall biosynthesis